MHARGNDWGDKPFCVASAFLMCFHYSVSSYLALTHLKHLIILIKGGAHIY